MPQDFNPHSIDATLATMLAEQRAFSATVLARLNSQDEKLDGLIVQTTKTNGRVTRLEEATLDERLQTLEVKVQQGKGAWKVVLGICALIAFAVSVAEVYVLAHENDAPAAKTAPAKP